MARIEEDQKEKQESPFKRIDNAMGAYYRLCGRRDYFRDDGRGKFLYYCDENEFNPDDIDEELTADPPDCGYWDALQSTFPFDTSIQTQQDKEKELQNVLRYCYKYGRTPLPISRQPKPIQYEKQCIRKRIKIILAICCPDQPEQHDKPKKSILNIKNIKIKSIKQKKKKGDKDDIQIEGKEEKKDDIQIKSNVIIKTQESKEDDNDPITALAHFAQHFGPNGLLQICEIIIRHQMRYSLDNDGKLDVELYSILQKWVIKRHIYIQKDLNLLNRHLLTRAIPYTGILTALHSEFKICASPKPLQLAVMLLINNFSAEIIKAYILQMIPTAFFSIDIIGIYSKKIWDFIKKNVENKEAETAKTKFKGKDDKKDFKYLLNMKYSDHLFGTILESILKNKGKNRFLIRIYLELYDLDGQYPKVIICIEDVDENQRSSLDKSLYADLTSEQHPSYSYPMALMRRRYYMDMVKVTDTLQKKTSNSLKNVFKSKDYQKEKFNNNEPVEYIMITYLIYPIQPKKTSKDEKDLPHLYITKLYLNFADSIMRINEDDILEILPLFFNDESNLKLEPEQIKEIQEKRRENHAQQFDIDSDIEEQFKRYLDSLKPPKSPKSPKSQTSNDSNT